MLCGLKAPLARLYHNDECIHAAGRATGQMFEARFHIEDNDFIQPEDKMADQAAQKHVLGTVATRTRFFRLSHDEKPHTLVVDAVPVGNVINLGVDAEHAAR